jgi:hypothetical protein
VADGRQAEHVRLAEPVHEAPLADGAHRVAESERTHDTARRRRTSRSLLGERRIAAELPIGIEPTAEAITGARAPGSDSSDR